MEQSRLISEIFNDRANRMSLIIGISLISFQSIMNTVFLYIDVINRYTIELKDFGLIYLYMDVCSVIQILLEKSVFKYIDYTEITELLVKIYVLVITKKKKIINTLN